MVYSALSSCKTAVSAVRLITWNINSVRLRADNVCRLLSEAQPDILCLQETKTPDELFPREPFESMGYAHIHMHGMKGYNGVAILAKSPFPSMATRAWCDRNDCRHAIAELPGGIELHNIYVPAGGDIPDPEANPKFAHKLQFLDELTAWFAAENKPGKKMIAVGDLNIAPLEQDVWSHKALLSVVSHTPIEVEKLGQAQTAGPWVDALRTRVPEDQKLYPWWSYRAADGSLANEGRRLDLIWVSPALDEKVVSKEVLKD